ncbi:MAG: hypothetical protein ABI969_00815 [bacterium]
MTDMEIASSGRPLTPRQDRLEAEMLAVLQRRGTRSSLRVLVDEFADRARVQGTPPEAALKTVTSIAQRASTEMPGYDDAAVGESVPDRMAMMERWFKSRYHRAD